MAQGASALEAARGGSRHGSGLCPSRDSSFQPKKNAKDCVDERNRLWLIMFLCFSFLNCCLSNSVQHN